MELAVTAFRLMAPALQAPSRDREVEMQADVQAATASTVDPLLARVLAKLAEAAELLGVAEAADLAAETAGRLQALRLEVAVVGEFKRGKSSLINALVGREVLPTDSADHQSPRHHLDQPTRTKPVSPHLTRTGWLQAVRRLLLSLCCCP